MGQIQIDRLDGLSSSTAIKGPCRCATTANIDLRDLQVVDGVMVEEGDRVLVRAQTDPRENGIYVASTGQWRRAKDFSSNRDVRKGTRVAVTDGDSGPAELEVSTGAPAIAIGLNPIEFELSAGSLNAAGLSQARADAEAARDQAAGYAQSASDSASAALSARDAAIAAAEASGDVLFFDTYADAEDALGGLSEGQIVRVFADEARDGQMSWYRVESGALVHIPVVALARADFGLASFSYYDPSFVLPGGHDLGDLTKHAPFSSENHARRVMDLAHGTGTIINLGDLT